MVKRMFRERRGLLLAILILAALASLIIFRGVQRKPNVLWITLDSCRYDHLGCYGYQRAHTPNIDALVQQGTAFSQAISQASNTRASVPSMVTGRYPLMFQARGFAWEPDESHITVAEVLRERGYCTLVITREHPVKAAARGFEEIDDTADPTVRRTLSCLRVLQELQDETFFVWLYYWDPHAPYRPPARFLDLFEPALGKGDGRMLSNGSSMRKRTLRDQAGRLRGEMGVLGRINFQGDLIPTEADREHIVNLYDAEIAFVDSEIEKLIATLHQLKLWDNTMVIISADHGEAFGEHLKYYHGLNLYDEVIRVPLIIKPPHSRVGGQVLEAQVRNVDIMPTILDYCGAPIPGDIDGMSLRPAMEGKPLMDRPAYMETYFRKRDCVDHLFLGYRTGTYKLVYDIAQGSGELYDLERDPGEKTNILQVPSQEGGEGPAGSLEDQIKEAFLDHVGVESLERLAQMKLREEMDSDTEERLRALGYIE